VLKYPQPFYVSTDIEIQEAKNIKALTWFIVFLVLTSAGCTKTEGKVAYYVCWDEQIVEHPGECPSMASEVQNIVKEKTRYVCPDDTVVDTQSKCPTTKTDDEALNALKARLAAGEITRDEYEATKELLIEW
jgi:hypothetical protein